MTSITSNPELGLNNHRMRKFHTKTSAKFGLSHEQLTRCSERQQLTRCSERLEQIGAAEQLELYLFVLGFPQNRRDSLLIVLLPLPHRARVSAVLVTLLLLLLLPLL